MENLSGQSPKFSKETSNATLNCNVLTDENSLESPQSIRSEKSVPKEAPTPVSNVKSNNKITNIINALMDVRKRSQRAKNEVAKGECSIKPQLQSKNKDTETLEMDEVKDTRHPLASGDNKEDKSSQKAFDICKDLRIREELQGAKKKSLKSNRTNPTISNCLISDVLDVSVQKIDFGVNLPGKVVEESLEITNKTDGEIVLQIDVDCLNPELKDSEEFVYSMRRSYTYDYNDKHSIILSSYSTCLFKVVLKVPNKRVDHKIIGESRITVRGAKGTHRIAFYSSASIPKVICPKELFSVEYNCSLIKLAIKQGKKPETKFPLKNLSELPVTLNLSFYQPKNFDENPLLQCIVHPCVVTIPPQGIVTISLSPKNWKAFIKPTNDPEIMSFKKVLIGAARNSAVIYSFLLWIELC